MFRGLNAINIDPKGRVAIPARYRDRLAQDAADQIVLTIDTEQRCLLLYPLPTWEEIERKLALLPTFNPIARRIQRLLIGHAVEMTLDSHGRILIPTLLRDYAMLDKRVMLLGQGNKFEIWHDENWERCREGWLKEELTEKLSELPEELKTIAL